MRKRIYISGPITGTEDFMERFSKAQKELEKQGYSVMNPAHANSYMPDDATYEEYMKVSFCLIDMCDSIYMLNGWEKSCGANREYNYALAKGKEIIMQEQTEDTILEEIDLAIGYTQDACKLYKAKYKEECSIDKLILEVLKKAKSEHMELRRWRTEKINRKIKNPFAWTSTVICHNCDHKDEYIEELEKEIEEYNNNTV